MTRQGSKDPLPALQISDEELEKVRSRYVELVGFLPPRVEARTDLLARLDPATLKLQEEIRTRLMNPAVFDVKTVQLMLFGILLALMGDGARLHAIAARRAGASWEELNAVVGLAFIFRGLPAANFGSQVLEEMAQEETKKA